MFLTHAGTQLEKPAEMDAANRMWWGDNSEAAIKAAIQRRNDFFFNCAGRGPTYLIIEEYKKQEWEFLRAQRASETEESKKRARAARRKKWMGRLMLVGQLGLDPFFVAVSANCYKVVYPLVEGYATAR